MAKLWKTAEKRGFIIILMTLFACVFWNPKASAQDYCSLENQHFELKEKATYKLYYNWRLVWIPAGIAKFSLSEVVEQGKRLWHAVATGETLRRYDLIFKVRDRYESYFEPETMLTRRFVRDVNEGGYEIDNDYRFRREENKVMAIHEDFKTPKDTSYFSVSDCIHDMLSASYYFRCLDFSSLEPGKTVPIEIFLDNEIYNLSLRQAGYETVKTKLGKFRCIKVKPTVIEGRIFEDEDAVTIYLTDDGNHIPVLIEAPIVVGSVKAVITEYESPRNAMSALID